MQEQKLRPTERPILPEREEQFSLSRRCNYALIMLGGWLLCTAVSSDYRNSNLFWNDIVTAILISSIALASFKFDWLRWVNAIVGTWLLLAPLIFWAPTSVSYTNDTLVGILVILLAFVFPGMPGAKRGVETGSAIPSGWSYNPSGWSQRLPLVSLAMIGFFIARYMAAYQLGHVESSWDPFLGNSTEKVLTSDVSRAFPMSDAGLGAFSYIIDALAGVIGGSRRWRTMPWMVILFGLLVIPPGVVSIVLVILQPVAVGAWCSLCLFASIVMLIMVPMAVDEVIATCQYLAKVRQEKMPFWSIFFRGGSEIPAHSKSIAVSEKFGGINIPLNLVACSIIGALLMISPTFNGAQDMALNNFYFTGALVVTTSFIAFAEVCRSVRLVNMLLAIWLLLAPFVLNGFNDNSRLTSIICGVVLIACSIKKGRIREQYAEWNRLIV